MEKKYDEGGNIVFDTEKQYVRFCINPKIYSVSIISQAAYVLMDRAAVILSGSPDDRIIAEIRPIDKEYDLHSLIKEFNDELLNYSSFFSFSEKSLAFRNALLNSILGGSQQAMSQQTQQVQQDRQASIPKDIRNDAQKDIDDVDRIFEEWEKDCDC